MEDKIIHIYTGDGLLIARLEQELAQNGIISLVKDGFQQGKAAGFMGGTPSAVELYVSENDVEQAIQIVKAITGE